MERNKIIIPLVVMVMGFGMLAVVPAAYAQTPGAPAHMGFFQGWVQFFAQKFGLEKTQVQNAMNEYHAQVKANITPRPTLSAQQMQDREKSKLDGLVSSGKITTAQEQALMNELAALRQKYPFDQNQTPDQRKTHMQAMQTDLKAWAQTQGIDPTLVMSRFGMRGKMDGDDMHGRRGGRGYWGQQPVPTITPAG